MSKTNPPPAPLPPPQLDHALAHHAERLSPHRSEALVYGGRECQFTTVTFILTRKNGDSISDTLMIGIDDHNGQPKTMLMIRGEFEAAELPGQLRWVADAIAKHVKDSSFAVNEYVSSHKSRGGAA